MTDDRIRQIAQSDPTSQIVERWGDAVIETRKRVAALEDSLRELEQVTGQLAERQLVVATDLGPTGNSARSAWLAATVDSGARTYTQPKAAA